MQTGQDFEMHAGSTKTLQFTVSEDGAALDLTGCTVNWKAGESQLSKAGEVTDAEAGQVLVTLVPADTDGWSGRRLDHQLVVVDGAGTDAVVAVGTMVVRDRLGD